MKIVKPEELPQLLKNQINEIRNSDDAIEQFIHFFNAFKIKEKLNHAEEDMLLFQYDNEDLGDGNKEQ
ncbi:MAG: hypothetical protein AB8G22_18520, partial [Saprospiraceae bacterium]